MSHHVTAPLVVTKNENGSDLYLYQGAPVPSHVSAEELKRLEADDLIAKDASENSDKPAAKK